ncbi:DUF1798 family protein [Bacillus sp. NPDC077027]|uniref:DUF1798 family protein n=1 Tax=Bacillus sp. NPDC077027 TaxID=3390548 RepID=UPI003D021E7E
MKIEIETLLEQTEWLLTLTDEAYTRFQKGKEEEVYPAFDFYTDIQPAVERLETHMTDWLQTASLFVKDRKPKYLHQEQLKAVEENLKEVVLQSYFGKLQPTRVKNLVESVTYTLNLLIEEVKNEKRS